MPSSRRNKRAKTATPPPILPQSPNNRQPIRPEDVCVGCIAWLPSHMKKTHILKCMKTNEVLEETGYDHPVVILSVKRAAENPADESMVCIAMLTSFNSTPLAHYFSHSANGKYRHCLPIISNDVEVATTHLATPSTLLRLENQSKLRKQSYVLLQHIYTIPLSLLRAYEFSRSARAYQKRLEKESYNALMNALTLCPEDFQSTESLGRSSITSHQEPARAEQLRSSLVKEPYSEIIHQAAQAQIRSFHTIGDSSPTESTLRYEQSSPYRPEPLLSPTSTYRSYNTTVPPMPLPQPLPQPLPTTSQVVEHKREGWPPTNSTSSISGYSGWMIFGAIVLVVLCYSYWKEGWYGRGH